MGEQRLGYTVLEIVDSREQLHHDRRRRDRGDEGDIESTILRAVRDDRGNDRYATHSR